MTCTSFNFEISYKYMREKNPTITRWRRPCKHSQNGYLPILASRSLSFSSLWTAQRVEQRVLNGLYMAFLRLYNSTPRPPIPPPPVIIFSSFLSLPVCRRSSLYWRERGGLGWGGRGAKSYDGEKAWPSLNHSILSAVDGSNIQGGQMKSGQIIFFR